MKCICVYVCYLIQFHKCRNERAKNISEKERRHTQKYVKATTQKKKTRNKTIKCDAMHNFLSLLKMYERFANRHIAAKSIEFSIYFEQMHGAVVIPFFFFIQKTFCFVIIFDCLHRIYRFMSFILLQLHNSNQIFILITFMYMQMKMCADMESIFVFLIKMVYCMNQL